MAGEYRIQQVDGDDDDIADTLRELDEHCFNADHPGGAVPDFTKGFWWLVLSRGEAVGYAGLTQSTWHHTAGYFKRVGVRKDHTGQGLQRRLIDVRLRKARAHGWGFAITDCTTCNPASANSLIARGFKVFMPRTPWALDNSIYWRKTL